MKKSKSMWRRGRFTAAAGLAVAGAVALVCYGYGVAPAPFATGTTSQAETVQAEAAQTATAEESDAKPVKAKYDKDGFNLNYDKQLAALRQPVAAIGETIAIDSSKFSVPFCKGDAGRIYDWNGTMEFTVLSADVYDNIDDAPIGTKRAKGYANEEIARDYAKDGGYFVFFKVKVRNVDAVLGEDGYLLTTLLEPAGSVGASDSVYLDCADAGTVNSEKPEYVRVDKGKTETFTCGWAVMPRKDGATADRLQFDQDGLNSVSLARAADHRSGVTG